MTHKEEWNLRHGFSPSKAHSRAQLAKLGRVPLSALNQVYERGVGAHRTNLRSVRLKGSFMKNVDAPASMKLSPAQWGTARVYAFLNKREKGTPLNHDRDIAERLRPSAPRSGRTA